MDDCNLCYSKQCTLKYPQVDTFPPKIQKIKLTPQPIFKYGPKFFVFAFNLGDYNDNHKLGIKKKEGTKARSKQGMTFKDTFVMPMKSISQPLT